MFIYSGLETVPIFHRGKVAERSTCVNHKALKADFYFDEHHPWQLPTGHQIELQTSRADRDITRPAAILSHGSGSAEKRQLKVRRWLHSGASSLYHTSVHCKKGVSPNLVSIEAFVTNRDHIITSPANDNFLATGDELLTGFIEKYSDWIDRVGTTP